MTATVGSWGSIALGGLLTGAGVARALDGRAGGLVLALAGTAFLRRGLGGRAAREDVADHERAVQLSRTITLDRPIERVRGFLEEPANLARFVPGVIAARPIGGHRLCVCTMGPDVEVDVERDGPDSFRFWSRAPWFEIEEGTIELSPARGGRATEVAIELLVVPPGGRAGAALLRLLREAPRASIVGEALYRLRALLEAGEIPVSDDTSARHAREVEEVRS